MRKIMIPAGESFGALVVTGPPKTIESKSGKPTSCYPCQCSCGNTTWAVASALKSGRKRTCGCRTALWPVVGERHGRLEIIEDLGVAGKRSGRRVKCLCDCGKTTTAIYANLKRKTSQSCGCLRQYSGESEGLTGAVVDGTWRSMMNRCYIKSDASFKNYGAKGIRVAKEWHDLDTFKSWAEANNWKSGLTIERVDVLADYSPQNCEWISRRAQAGNKRNTIIWSYQGKDFDSAVSIAKFLGIHASTVKSRCKSESRSEYEWRWKYPECHQS